MEKLATLTQTDINAGVLTRMLSRAGIPDVQDYVRQFNNQVEELVIEELANSDPNETEFNEHIAPPEDIEACVASLRIRLDDPVKKSTSKPQEPPKKQPADLKSWMHGMVSNDNQTPTGDSSSPTTTDSDGPTVTGNMGTWLTNWSKSLGEQPPPKSLDDWLHGLVTSNLHEPIGKANSSQGRFQAYLNSAEKVLSQHGYDVSTTTPSSNNVEAKIGTISNVKKLYFLWRTLDKNKDGKITVDDIQIMFTEMGLGFLSKYAAQTLFDMVDSNHDGQLQFRDFVALMSIVKQLISAANSK